MAEESNHQVCPSCHSRPGEVLEDIIGEENEDRCAMVYPRLAEDMAKAARGIYDACLKGQEYAETQETS